MGRGQQIVLCQSLETGPLSDYLDSPHDGSVQQQESHLEDNQFGLGTPENGISHLSEAIECVLNLMDSNRARVGNISQNDGEIQRPSPAPVADHNSSTKTGPSWKSSLREQYRTLCRLQETLSNYYLEKCVHGQEMAAAATLSELGPANHLNISSMALPDTISHASSTAVSAPFSFTSTSVFATTPTRMAMELGGLFVNDSITSDSLNQLQAATTTTTGPLGQQPLTYHWNFLFFVIIFIIAGGLGNILVCLAIALDRKLQNVTNYFLLSLAIADLLVSLFVMPLGAIPTFLGKTITRAN